MPTVLVSAKVSAGIPDPAVTITIEVQVPGGIFVIVDRTFFPPTPPGSVRELRSNVTSDVLLAKVGSAYGTFALRAEVIFKNSWGEKKIYSGVATFNIAAPAPPPIQLLPDFQEPPQACPLVGGCPTLDSVETSGGQIRATVTSTSNFATIVGITKAVDGQPAEAGQCLSGSCYIAGSKDYPDYSAPSRVGVGAQYGRGTSTKTMTRLGGNWEPIIFDKGVYYVNLYTDDGVEQLHAARKSITVR